VLLSDFYIPDAFEGVPTLEETGAIDAKPGTKTTDNLRRPFVNGKDLGQSKLPSIGESGDLENSRCN
jgi:hypothetical protein